MDAPDLRGKASGVPLFVRISGGTCNDETHKGSVGSDAGLVIGTVSTFELHIET